MPKIVKTFSLLTLLVLIVFPTVKAQDGVEDDGRDIRSDPRGIPMVYVPPGSFEMGVPLDEAVSLCEELAITEGFPLCNADYITNARQDPLITDIGAFYIDQYEVSRSDYVACVDADVCSDEPLMRQPPEPLDVPIQYATYYDAAVYCAWREGRLPTEAEWEYAARSPESLTFPWGDEFNGNLTNHCDVNCSILGDKASLSVWDDSYVELAPIDVFEKDQSWIGAYNLAGNILEWTSTRSELNRSPSDDLRVIKGGSYDSYPYQTTGWFKASHNSSQGRANIGFRCIRTTEPS